MTNTVPVKDAKSQVITNLLVKMLQTDIKNEDFYRNFDEEESGLLDDVILGNVLPIDIKEDTNTYRYVKQAKDELFKSLIKDKMRKAIEKNEYLQEFFSYDEILFIEDIQRHQLDEHEDKDIVKEARTEVLKSLLAQIYMSKAELQDFDWIDDYGIRNTIIEGQNENNKVSFFRRFWHSFSS